jgi:hypothetical protein
MARMVALVAQRGGDLDTALEQVRGSAYGKCKLQVTSFCVLVGE